MNKQNITQIYATAAAAVGRASAELRQIAVRSFGSVMLQCLERPGNYVWTAAKVEHGKLDFEVGALPGTRPKRGERTCVICGCTRSRACKGGCCWIEEHPFTNTGVCSKCDEIALKRLVSAMDEADTSVQLTDVGWAYSREQRTEAAK